MKHKLRWESASRTAYLDDVYLSPKKSQKVWNHSPDGFEIGYNGSGPTQLALAIMLEIADKGIAISQYKKFRSDVIATLPKGQNCEIEFEF